MLRVSVHHHPPPLCSPPPPPPLSTAGRILEITKEITATAPEPVLSVMVRQDGQEVDTSLNVRPGAPLDMEISLDAKSSSTYGIIVSDMIVSDTKKQEELLLTNGSVQL